MPSEVELKYNRRQTAAFIAYDAITVVLQHASVVPTAAGGMTRTSTSSRDPQTARMLPMGSGATAPVRRQVDGEEVAAQFLLVLPWDAEVERGDWYYHDGLKYEVVWVPEHPQRFYETKVEVTLRG